MLSFELHSVANLAAAVHPPALAVPSGGHALEIDHHFDDESQSHETSVLAINELDGWVGLNINGFTGHLCRVANRSVALAEFKVVARRVSAGLVMLPHVPDILVNGEPVQDMQVLNVRDSLILIPGGPLAYVTSRFVPYIGPPTEEMLAKKLKCPMCRLTFDNPPGGKPTQVLTCICGCVMHYETSASHPEETENSRLSCATKKLANCLSCGRPIVFEPTLVWDPTELGATET